MLMFGHPGITLGAAALLDALRSRRASQLKLSEGVVSRASWFDSLAGHVDIRILAIGSLLPDIIDKPVGHVFFRETFSGGRIFSHTLLFLALISLAGVYLYRRRRQNWLLVLAFGTFTHLVLDQMWQTPHTLLWPAFGFGFDKGDLTNWLPGMFQALLTSPEVYVPELLGGLILAWFGVWLLRRKKLLAFIWHGRMT